MIDEKWDLYDYEGNRLSKTINRGNFVLKRGEYHLVVHIWIVSRSGAFLIQRRADTKKLMPGEWAATGGAVISGEDSFTAAKRELFEELGIFSNSKTLKKLMRIRRRNSFIDVYVIRKDIHVDDLTLQKSEVATAKWVSKNDLLKMIEDGKFHNYGKEYFDSVFSAIDDFRSVTV